MSSISSSLICPSFLINSRDRLNGTISSFQYQLHLPPGNNYTAVGLISATITKSWYSINANTNTFILKELGVSRTITIPVGNYNTTNFKVVLKAQLDAASVLNGNNWVYTITQPNISIEAETYKFTYTVAGNAGNQPTFIFVGDKIHEFLGFEADTTKPFVGDSLTSTTLYNFQHTRYVVIKSNLCLNQGNNSADSSILAIISTQNTQDGQSIFHTVSQIEEAQRVLAHPGSQTVSFSLYDDHDRLMEMNGVDWKMQIICWEHNKYYSMGIDYFLSQKNNKPLITEELTTFESPIS